MGGLFTTTQDLNNAITTANRTALSSNAPMNVCVIGAHGVGKSAFINTYLRWYNNEYTIYPRPREVAPVGAAGDQTTTNVSCYETDNKKVCLFDIPGWQENFSASWVRMVRSIVKTGVIPGRVVHHGNLRWINSSNGNYKCHVVVFVLAAQNLDNVQFCKVAKKVSRRLRVNSRHPLCVITRSKSIYPWSFNSYVTSAKTVLNTQQVYGTESISDYRNLSTSRDFYTEPQLKLLTDALFDAAELRIKYESDKARYKTASSNATINTISDSDSETSDSQDEAESESNEDDSEHTSMEDDMEDSEDTGKEEKEKVKKKDVSLKEIKLEPEKIEKKGGKNEKFKEGGHIKNEKEVSEKEKKKREKT